jgi:hypothetical protein
VKRPAEAAIAYTAIAVLMTWPLAQVITTQIAWDLGDPVFNSWVMLWTGGQLLETFSGNLNAIHEYWHGNIFHPSSLTIAYSEHLTPQTLQILPILAATDNIVLCYNLLFLSTFVLSGLGMYLLVRDLTGRPWAAFLAGLAFAFAPYRISQYSHLQVLSSQWMPFALLGLRRYFARVEAGAGRRRQALAGGAGAIVVQNLSCGYYLLFFTPFVAAFAIVEMARRGLLRRMRVWGELAVAAAATLALTWPFVSPYLELRVHGDVGVRSYEEAVQFSADTYSFATASAHSTIWGIHGWRLLAFPKGEGEGFPGFTIFALAAVAIGWAVWRTIRAVSVPAGQRFQQAALIAIAALFVVDVAALLMLFVTGSLPIRVDGRPWRDTDPFLIAAVVLPASAALVPAWRRALRASPGSIVGFAAVSAIAAALLALGPRIFSAGRLLGTGPYMWLYAYVPGFDGVRVPARFLMVAAFFLALLAGIGAAQILARSRRAGAVAVLAGTVGILAESWVAPMPMNVRLAPFGFNLTPRRLDMGEDISPLYRLIRDEPGKVALIEFPYGEPAYEILATFYAGYHRRPLVNGYSGFFPEGYLRRRNFLAGIPFDLEAATRSLRSSGATHALVHEAAFTGGRGKEISAWLTSIGARQLASHGTDKLFLLR